MNWLVAVTILVGLVCSTSCFPFLKPNVELVHAAISQSGSNNGEPNDAAKLAQDDVPRLQVAAATVNASISDPMYFKQKLDHFDLSNKQTWQQRYWVDKTNFFGDGPVFLIIGDQAEATPEMITNTQVTKYARTYNALVVLVEHRFYGGSIPTANLSNENLRFLTIEQALEDLVDIRAYMVKSMGLKSTNLWIAFGTLYAGNIAAWLRLKHPSWVRGAVASSAPLLAKFEADLYLENVASAITDLDPQCTIAIQKANDQLDDLINSQGGLQSLQDMFRTCSPIKTNNDISLFFFNNAITFSQTVEYDSNNRLPDSLGLESACQTMLNASLGNELARYKKYLLDRMDYDNVTCMEVSYDPLIEIISNTTDNETDYRPYVYQYCAQLGQFETSRSTNQPFGHHISQQLWISLCNDGFGFAYDTDSVKVAMEVTNSNYGGLNYQGSNVVFVSGTLDPWRDLGYTASSHALNPNKNIDVIEIKGAGSSADFLNMGTNDTAAVTEAKGKISVIIGKYLFS